ncbi:MAG: rhomboid family intramembrane serine protease [Actinomycetota bacterium]|nr:rhomboid family intramembrane serine protease [Actinomycetota bacterium]
MTTPLPTRRREPMQGLVLLASIVALMWIVEVINSLDGYGLNSDGLHARNVGELWGIFTAPFLHASWPHLIDNTIPFVFMGVIIALRGAARLALVTVIVIVIGGLGTWLIAPGGNAVTIGASGVVFGYATYLLTRGLFNRSWLEILVGVVVGVVWGGALASSLVPQHGVSWQAHASGAVAGVIAAAILARPRPSRSPGTGGAGAGQAQTLPNRALFLEPSDFRRP